MPDTLNLPRESKGKRPHFFDDSAVDHLLAMILELSAELSVVYSRVDTMERLLDEAKIIDRSRMESYEPDATADTERAEWRALFLDRLFRTVNQERAQTSV